VKGAAWALHRAAVIKAQGGKCLHEWCAKTKPLDVVLLRPKVWAALCRSCRTRWDATVRGSARRIWRYGYRQDIGRQPGHAVPTMIAVRTKVPLSANVPSGSSTVCPLWRWSHARTIGEAPVGR
jgi:hypothetical protein